MSKRALKRRSFLRGALAFGAGATVGLPLLDAMVDSSGTALADGTPLPKRFALWFWGNGLVPGQTNPSEIGAGWTPTGVLSGLSRVSEHVHIVSGTELPRAHRTIEHIEGPVHMLTGGNTVNEDGIDSFAYYTVAAPSIDEVAADFLGTPVHRSLVMAVTQLHTTSGGPGTAIRYTSHRGPYSFNEPTFDPVELFERLFAGVTSPTDPTGPAEPRRLRARVLDAVLEDGARLRARLGAADRVRLEQHLDGIRDLERRLEALDPSGAPPVSSSCDPEPVSRPGTDRERARLFADITAMAFACDLTRVANLEFSSPASHSTLPDIFTSDEVRGTFHEYHHESGFNERVVRGFTYLMDCFGDFVSALAEFPEAGGSLLDSTVVLGTSDVANGHTHGMSDHPVLIAGHAGLPARGTHVHLPGANSARAALTCLRALGWREEYWGYEQLRTRDGIDDLLVG